jgi:AcrR family transcriptional regulator
MAARSGPEPAMTTGGGAARGRHAPPLEVRLPLQRGRLLQAAAEEFASRGYAQASSESISRRAGMSKATFYEHFANKEDCMIALFDTAADTVVRSVAEAAENAGTDPKERLKAAMRAFLTTLSEHPAFAQTLLVEIFGAGPNAARRRDESLQQYAELLDAENAAAAEQGLIERFRSQYDAIAIVGAINELVSRQVRLGEPQDVLELAPVIDRLIAGLLTPGA